MKKYYRYFGGFIDTQEKWLNEMANKGYRLIDSNKISYIFEECQPNQYKYAVEFIGQYGSKSAKKYKLFIEDLGYKVFYKNINLNFSVGKAKWRPYGKGAGQISTSPGTYNKELLILEKSADGKPFELHNTNFDKVNYYKPLRNAWLTITMLTLLFSIWQLITTEAFRKEFILFAILGIIALVATINYQKRIAFYTKQSILEE